jgi:Ca-activated chloride channel family protein
MKNRSFRSPGTFINWLQYARLMVISLLCVCLLGLTVLVGCSSGGWSGAYDRPVSYTSQPGSAWNKQTSSAHNPSYPLGGGPTTLRPSGQPIVNARDISGHYQADEEIWVIARNHVVPPRPVRVEDNIPGSGALVTRLKDDHGQIITVPVPLKHTDVKATLGGYIATVNVKQQFHNPYDEKIEAVYVFPLPSNAAVNEFVMTLSNKRKIRGIIRDKAEAEAIYKAARRQGYNASLMTQQRPNIFTQRVANIEPGKRIDIDIKYFHTLSYRDGWYEFVFPMVVGPRYNSPAGSGAGQGIGAVARGTSGGGQKTEVQYLRPQERSGHDISLSVDIDAGVVIEQFRSVNHRITSKLVHHAGQDKQNDAPIRHIELALDDRVPNKDFVLRYRVTGQRIRSQLLVHQDARGKFFSLMIYPPAQPKLLSRQPMEMIFVVDCSGSMRGRPLDQARDAVNYALGQLRPSDSFQIIRFSNEASHFGPKPVAATEANIERGKSYMRSLTANGGTEMIQGVRSALDFPHDAERYRVVTFLTDGFIGNDFEILKAVHKNLGPARIFSFGVGSSPNRFLMDRMAKLGRGAVAYLSLKDNASVVMSAYFERISQPAVTDLQIDFGDMDVYDVYPQRTPDLFVGRPVLLTGRFKGSLGGPIIVKGRSASRQVRIEVATDRSAQADGAHSALAGVWARRQIAELVDQQVQNLDPHRELEGQIKRVALEYGLMSPYTAFVAVDSQSRTEGSHGTTVPVPVPVPQGVRYETTVDHGRSNRP